jgi:hypothetical protein
MFATGFATFAIAALSHVQHNARAFQASSPKTFPGSHLRPFFLDFGRLPPSLRGLEKPIVGSPGQPRRWVAHSLDSWTHGFAYSDERTAMPESARLSADRSDEMNRTRQCVQCLGYERSGERELLGVSERQRGVKSPLQLVVTAGVRPWTIHLHHIDGLYTGRRRLAFRFRCANAEKFLAS